MGSKSKPMRHTLDHFWGTSGNVKTMLLFRRSITFEVGGGPGRSPLHHLGNTFLKHAFWSSLLKDFLGFGLPLGSLRRSFGSTFLHCFFCTGENKKHYAFGGAGGRGGACLSLQILQSLHKDSITPCSPPLCGGAANLEASPPAAGPLQLKANS